MAYARCMPTRKVSIMRDEHTPFLSSKRQMIGINCTRQAGLQSGGHIDSSSTKTLRDCR